MNQTSTTTPDAERALVADAAQEADEHLGVDALRDNLPRASARASALMIGSNAVQLVLGVTGTAVLARVLRPADFGYLFLVTTLTNFVATFRDFGLPMATVQKATLSHEQVSGLFWVNCVASCSRIIKTGCMCSTPWPRRPTGARPCPKARPRG